MIASKPLSEMLSTLLERRAFGRKNADKRRIREDCIKLLAERAEISGLQLAAKIFGQYDALDSDERAEFFEFLKGDGLN